jgi:hypothetical protein
MFKNNATPTRAPPSAGHRTLRRNCCCCEVVNVSRLNIFECSAMFNGFPQSSGAVGVPQ